VGSGLSGAADVAVPDRPARRDHLPHWIVHGTADAAIPVARAEAVRDSLSGPVRFIVVEGAAHASNVTHPDEVNLAIPGFLSELGG
jgi:3-oxoadipate enol-lactonase